MNYNNKWLLDSIAGGKQFKYLFFWGHQPSKDGHVAKSCFSQWWQSPFLDNGITYQTAEHWMMAAKARLFNDTEIMEQIIAAESPGEVKKLGRMIGGFDPGVWDENKYQIVVEGNYKKFSQHDDLKSFLINTGDRILVEASPVDSIWGIGMEEKHSGVENPLNWKGENLLGYALMEVRDKLQSK